MSRPDEIKPMRMDPPSPETIANLRAVNPLIDWDAYDREVALVHERRAGYFSKDYTGNLCRNCGRNRVMNCANGKHVCEKCGWDADVNALDPFYVP